MKKPKFIIAIHGKDTTGKDITDKNPKFVYSFNLEADRLATTSDLFEAKVFRSEDEVQGVIDELMTLSKTVKYNWVFSYVEKP